MQIHVAANDWLCRLSATGSWTGLSANVWTGLSANGWTGLFANGQRLVKVLAIISTPDSSFVSGSELTKRHPPFQELCAANG